MKGFSQLCSSIPEAMRGRCGPGQSDFATEYPGSRSLAIELLPIHHCWNDHSPEEKGLANYWGYNSPSIAAF